MFFNLLSNSGNQNTNNWGSWILMGGLLAVIIVFTVFNRRSQQKRQQETMNMLDAIQPGNKVKTIGGICGVVVEVCPEDNTFIMETGSEKSGKSYLKFDKQAVYQTDATAKKQEAPVVESAPVDPVFEETAEVAEETPVEEPAVDSVEETTEA